MLRRAAGVVYLIGAGPGDPDLITVKGKRLLEAGGAGWLVFTSENGVRRFFERFLARCGDLRGVPVIRVRGALADAALEERLREAGIEASPLTVYRTCHATWPEGFKAKLFDHPPHAVVFASGSAVAGLFSNLTVPEVRKLASKALIASIGPMTTRALRKKGLKASLEVSERTAPALVKAIVRHRALLQG
ncbi:MAG: uroporphyrinogen-III synthase [Elusimicrobia bacterium]|nr:uroporphyrinogen-III synthase [Elusimicrobiota bacterium]